MCPINPTKYFFNFVILENGKSGKIIHNYGHGGSGVTTAWGCASDVLDLTKKHLAGFYNLKSKM